MCNQWQLHHPAAPLKTSPVIAILQMHGTFKSKADSISVLKKKSSIGGNMQHSIWVLGKLLYMWYSWRGMAVAIIMAPPTGISEMANERQGQKEIEGWDQSGKKKQRWHPHLMKVNPKKRWQAYFQQIKSYEGGDEGLLGPPYKYIIQI